MTKSLSTAKSDSKAALTNQLSDLLSKGLTLRKIAHASGANYGKLLKASRQPIPGVPYDPEALNFAAMVEVLQPVAEQFAAVDWDEVLQKGVRKVSVVKDIEAFKVGTKVYLRRSENSFEIVWTTDTHVVILEENSTEPRCWSWDTFLANGPALEPRQK